MTSMYEPDRWFIIKIEKGKDIVYKLFSTWLGGYGSGDSWRLNSGITKVTTDNKHYYFYGESGSCYKVSKAAKGVSFYTQGVIDNFIKQAKGNIDYKVSIVSDPDKIIEEVLMAKKEEGSD